MQLNTSLPFTRTEALAAGITADQLAGPRYQRLFQGIYLSAHVAATVQLRAKAALRVSAAGSWVSHHTAGELWGGWMPRTTDTHLTVPDGSSRTERRGINAHAARPEVKPSMRYGLPVSSPRDVFFDLASMRLDLVDLVVAGDSLVRATPLMPEDLVAASATWAGRGTRLARRAAQLVRSGVDSAPESRLRLLIVLAGLPEPKVNLIMRGQQGEWKRRFDMCYPELKLIIEYDGLWHAEDARQWSSDLLRREELERLGWRLIVINKDALNGDPLGTLLRIRQALRDRGCPGLRRSLAPTWRRHFPLRRAAAA